MDEKRESAESRGLGRCENIVEHLYERIFQWAKLFSTEVRGGKVVKGWNVAEDAEGAKVRKLLVFWFFKHEGKQLTNSTRIYWKVTKMGLNA